MSGLAMGLWAFGAVFAVAGCLGGFVEGSRIDPSARAGGEGRRAVYAAMAAFGGILMIFALIETLVSTGQAGPMRP